MFVSTKTTLHTEYALVIFQNGTESLGIEKNGNSHSQGFLRKVYFPIICFPESFNQVGLIQSNIGGKKFSLDFIFSI